MKTSSLDIYSTTKQHNSPLSTVGKTQTQDWENFYNLNSPKLNSNATSNPEIILTLLRLDAIESELATACSRYSQLCQELDAITFQNEQYCRCSLELERDQTCQEILSIIHQISRLEIERINTESTLNYSILED
ncbi:MAG: hypothetical protein VKK42_11690 [Lyngbya sp.]|nr:hypothetical protein [Lyngbya sp.]